MVSFEERDPALLYRIARTPGIGNRLLRSIIANLLLMFLFAMLSLVWASRALAALMVACLFLVLAGGAVYKPLVWMSEHQDD